MSIDGVVLSDVKRWLAQGGSSACFAVIGDKGSGRTTTLRSVTAGLLSGGGYTAAADMDACLLDEDDDANHHSDAYTRPLAHPADSTRPTRSPATSYAKDIPHTTKYLFLVDYLVLRQLTRRHSRRASCERPNHHDKGTPPLCQRLRPQTIVVVDDLDALWSLAACHASNSSSDVCALSSLMQSILRSQGCLLVLSARRANAAALQQTLLTQSPPASSSAHAYSSSWLLYSLPPLTVAAARRVVRRLHDGTLSRSSSSSSSSSFARFVSACESGMDAWTRRRDGGQNASRRDVLTSLCLASLPDTHALAASEAVEMTASADTSRAVCRNQIVTATGPTLYGLDVIYDRLHRMIMTMQTAFYQGNHNHNSHHYNSIHNGNACMNYCELGTSPSLPRREGGGGRLISHMTPVTGMLLHGASGCGKTALMRRLAQDCPCVSFIHVECTRLFSKYLGDSEERLRAVYRRARASRPAVVVLDAIDVIATSRGCAGGSRGSGSSGGGKGIDVHRRMLACLLCELDGVDDARGVCTIGLTSALHTMDSALLRQGRLETVLWVPPLSAPAAHAMTAHVFDQLCSAGVIHMNGTNACASAGECVERGSARACVCGRESVDEAVRLVAQKAVGCSPAALMYMLRMMVECVDEELCGADGEDGEGGVRQKGAAAREVCGGWCAVRECVDRVLSAHAYMLTPVAPVSSVMRSD